MNLRKIIQEEINDFEWIEDIPNTDLYRYFEVYVCYESYYGEDLLHECPEGGSYFFKIPTQVVPEIWDYEADDYYYAGPGDEGLDVIEWAIENGIMEPNDFDYAEYVTEKTKEEFCLAWGNYHDKELCKEFNDRHWLTDEPMNESDDFDWIQDEELPILPYVGKRFKLIRNGGEDSGRIYKILDYHYDDFNKDFYITTTRLDPNTLKPINKQHSMVFKAPMSRAMELINNGNWVFIDNINESNDFDWVKEMEPNQSDRYSFWLNKMMEILPNSFNEVEEFYSGKIIKTLSYLKNSMNRLSEELTELYLTDPSSKLNWLQASSHTVVNGVNDIVTAIRLRDEGKEWCESGKPYCENKTNKMVYESSLKDLKKRIPEMLRLLNLIGF